MQRPRIRLQKPFPVLAGNRHAQVAEMVLRPGDAEGGPDNSHRGSDQWLYVVSGCGTATVEGRRYPLRPGAMILIERGETHEIRAGKSAPLRTINLYVPPAYGKHDEPLPRGRSKRKAAPR